MPALTSMRREICETRERFPDFSRQTLAAQNSNMCDNIKNKIRYKYNLGEFRVCVTSKVLNDNNGIRDREIKTQRVEKE